jgi:hypothetical protein
MIYAVAGVRDPGYSVRIRDMVVEHLTTTTNAMTNPVHNMLLKQEHDLWVGPKIYKRILLSSCARPAAKPVEIDLARYMQMGLTKSPTLLPLNVKAGKGPIWFIGERFHNLPLLSLSVAWLMWEAS